MLTRLAAKEARAVRTPDTLSAARSTERRQPPQCIFSMASVSMAGAPAGLTPFAFA